ncbi:hypothetical protein J4231_02350 [Candidatus Woesearchaeota archaeon]|nr:hypothetical protein [Candidatus Woesearchaeota archaeon]
MKQKKKGAVELSITTIIIIVMGITLLILGLGLISKIMSGTGDLTTKVIGNADAMIDNLLIDSKFTMPGQVIIEQGKVTTVLVTVGHDGSTVQGPAKFKVQLQKNFPNGIDETMVLAEVITPETVINEGQQAKFTIKIAASSNAPITTGMNAAAYSVVVTANGQPYDQGAFIINIQKGKGIFGIL